MTDSAGHRLFFVCVSEAVGSPSDLLAAMDDHRAHLARLSKDGRLVAAGRFLEEDGALTGTGMMVFAVAGLDEAKAIAEADPFHTTGLRRYTLRPWMVGEGSLLKALA
jgi:uncharacterized protein YciI